MRNLLEDGQVATNRLRRYPEFMDLPDAENLIQTAPKLVDRCDRRTGRARKARLSR
ncbi:hypothetical protein MEO94_29130 [Dolichospermum sp. ST_sed9]|nr:hypothetical protein [Dolichospermum sp. ST_sed9]